jgi:hypothetical protein
MERQSLSHLTSCSDRQQIKNPQVLAMPMMSGRDVRASVQMCGEKSYLLYLAAPRDLCRCWALSCSHDASQRESVDLRLHPMYLEQRQVGAMRMVHPCISTESAQHKDRRWTRNSKLQHEYPDSSIACIIVVGPWILEDSECSICRKCRSGNQIPRRLVIGIKSLQPVR